MAVQSEILFRIAGRGIRAREGGGAFRATRHRRGARRRWRYLWNIIALSAPTLVRTPIVKTL